MAATIFFVAFLLISLSFLAFEAIAMASRKAEEDDIYLVSRLIDATRTR